MSKCSMLQRPVENRNKYFFQNLPLILDFDVGRKSNIVSLAKNYKIHFADNTFFFRLIEKSVDSWNDIFVWSLE